MDTSIKTYDHAFVLLGLGWLSHTTKKQEHLNWLHKVWDFEKTHLSSQTKHGYGGFITSIPHSPLRLTNPHMHTFEAMLNLYELFGDVHWLNEAHKLYQLFTQVFFKQEEGVLREFFTEDWHPDLEKGMFVDPGHHYEWVWLLQKYESLSGVKVPQIPILYNWALQYGTGSQGLAYDESYFNGKVYRNTHRLWVQTETLKANLCMSKQASTESEKVLYHTRATKILELLFTHYFIEDKGIWYDQLDVNLNNISENAPASTLYHVFIALNEYINFTIN